MEESLLSGAYRFSMLDGRKQSQWARLRITSMLAFTSWAYSRSTDELWLSESDSLQVKKAWCEKSRWIKVSASGNKHGALDGFVVANGGEGSWWLLTFAAKVPSWSASPNLMAFHTCSSEQLGTGGRGCGAQLDWFNVGSIMLYCAFGFFLFWCSAVKTLSS